MRGSATNSCGMLSMTGALMHTCMRHKAHRRLPTWPCATRGHWVLSEETPCMLFPCICPTGPTRIPTRRNDPLNGSQKLWSSLGESTCHTHTGLFSATRRRPRNKNTIQPLWARCAFRRTEAQTNGRGPKPMARQFGCPAGNCAMIGHHTDGGPMQCGRMRQKGGRTTGLQGGAVRPHTMPVGAGSGKKQSNEDQLCKTNKYTSILPPCNNTLSQANDRAHTNKRRLRVHRKTAPTTQ